MLIEIKQILLSSPLVSQFLSENTVRSLLAKKHGYQEERDKRYKVPDAIFNLKTPSADFRVALELEMSQKSKARYKKLLRHLSTSDDFDLVMVVAKKAQIIELIRPILSDLWENDPVARLWKKRNGFYFVELENLLRDKKNAQLEGFKNAFTLESLAAAVLAKPSK